MAPTLGDELASIGERASAVASRASESSLMNALEGLIEAAELIRAAWSGSSLGYHALVYYEDLRPPPPGAHFSSEWGFQGVFQGTTGAWCEYPHDGVIAEIERKAGNPDRRSLRRDADAAKRIVEDAKDEAISVLKVLLSRQEDEYLRDSLARVSEVKVLGYEECVRYQLPSGQLMSRDSVAITSGIRSAPHQEVIADVVSIRSPFDAAAELASLCRRAARHLERLGADWAPLERATLTANRVVIGHGRSPLWRELKDFISERLGLQWDEFNRVPVAGVATADRLGQMLNSAAVAFLVATAEDEKASGDLVARQNVVHEVGLFQGHLGFSRAIVLLEDGCEEFSNIHGLGQIRFPRGHISAAFEEIRRVLEREGLV
jgi:predicted nucleotide-binding protein